jgi:hypothetical protein
MVWKVFQSTRDRATSLDAILSILRDCENVIDIRMDLRQFQITRSLNNRMGTGHGCRNFATQGPLPPT